MASLFTTTFIFIVALTVVMFMFSQGQVCQQSSVLGDALTNEKAFFDAVFNFIANPVNAGLAIIAVAGAVLSNQLLVFAPVAVYLYQLASVVNGVIDSFFSCYPLGANFDFLVLLTKIVFDSSIALAALAFYRGWFL